MKARTVAHALLLASLTLLLTSPSRGQSGIVVGNADSTLELGITASPTLEGLLAGLSPRFLVNEANSVRFYSLPPVPTPLQSILAQIGGRITIQGANSNHDFGLAYPLALVGDTVAPQVTGITVLPVGSNTVKVTWATDEFANSEVRYGNQSGSLLLLASDATWAKGHEVVLSGIQIGARYYYIVKSADRSGNASESTEANFILLSRVFLPFVRR